MKKKVIHPDNCVRCSTVGVKKITPIAGWILICRRCGAKYMSLKDIK